MRQNDGGRVDATDFPKPTAYFRPSRSSPANCRHLRRVRLHAAAPGCKTFDHEQHLPHPCHQSPSLVPSKSISNQHVPKACETDTSYSPIPASGPCFASTFTTPFGNFRTSWDNNSTILSESVVSHRAKLNANKKREAPSIYPTCILFALTKKGWIITRQAKFPEIA